jgi:hypothetical protein
LTGNAWNGADSLALASNTSCELAQSGYGPCPARGYDMDSIIYLVGLIVIVMFILSALGLR